MKKMSLKKGFTLIELLVVVAIIGILASVVLASLNTARAKGADAKVKAQMSSIRAAMEIYYSTNGNYGVAGCPTGDAPSGMAALFTASSWPNSVAPTCSGDAALSTRWSSSHVLSDGTFWCVDSSGGSKGQAAAAPALGAPCP